MSDLLDYAAACAGSYEGFPATWEDSARDVHAYLSAVAGMPCITFEGTSSFAEWWIDFQAVPYVPFGHPEFGALHPGFWETTGAVVGPIVTYLSGLGWPAYAVCGHSKGGGEALLMAARLKQLGHAPARVRAFEAPRVGTAKLRAYLADLDIAQTVTVNALRRDIVTCVPPDFPPWEFVDMRAPIVLAVPDSDEATQHRIPAVLAAVARLPAAA